MFESWVHFLGIALFGASVGYLISELFALFGTRSVREGVIEKNINLVKSKLREIEDKVGINCKEVATSRIDLHLQNIEKRLDDVLTKINQRGSEAHDEIERYKATPLTRTVFVKEDRGSTNEDDKNWNAYEKWRNEREGKANFGQFSEEKKLIDLYNEAIERRELRDTLWQKFQITQIENINAVEQRLGNIGKPEFRQSDNGNFYAIENPIEKNYLVVPKFDFTVKPTNYESTVKFVFECQNFSENDSYSQLKVLKPAIFVKSGETWNPSIKGELLLQR